MLEDIKNNKSKYISCIKINGIPILPPLLTDTKHKEIHKYKQEAIKLEKRLKTQREFRSYSKSDVPKLGRVITNSLEHKLAFEDNLNSEIQENSEICLSKEEVASVVKRKTPQLCCDLQVSQYTNYEFTVLTNYEKCKPQMEIIDKATSNSDKNYLSKENSFETETDISDIDNQRQRLIRSNSYILETPSPMLLEHLKKQSKFSENELYEHLWQNECALNGYIKDNNLIDKILLAKDNSPNHDDISFTDISNFDVSKSESELKNLSSLSNPNSENKITIVENQYDIKEFIDNNVPEMINNDLFPSNDATRIEVESPKESLVAIPNTCLNQLQHYSYYENETLMKVLNNIPEIYTKQILDLLEKQEQLSKLNRSTNTNRSGIDNHDLSNEEILLSNSFHHNRSSNLSNFDITSNCKQCSATSVKYDEESKFSEEKEDILSPLSKTESEVALSCSRELFPTICDTKVQQLLSQEHAASIIGAAARGYLVRRLMRTDRVQRLMQTIRDVLICAMQLHTENIDSIKESDVELHRRLIQQVSAACFEFHDVFFSLTTSEQMNLISQDREKRKEKLKRPLSRASSAGKSARSSKSSTNLR